VLGTIHHSLAQYKTIHHNEHYLIQSIVRYNTIHSLNITNNTFIVVTSVVEGRYHVYTSGKVDCNDYISVMEVYT